MLSLTPLRSFFLLSFLFLFFTAAGYIDTFDAVPSLKTAEALLSTGTLHVSPENGRGSHYVEIGEGKWFSKLGPGMPFLYLLPVAAGKFVNLFVHGYENYVSGFFVSMVNPLLTAILLTLVLYYFFNLEGRAWKSSLAATLVLGGTTLILPYAKTAHRETAQALFLLLSFLALKRVGKNPLDIASYWLLSLSIAFGALIKLALVVPAAAAFVPAVYWAFKSHKRWSAICALFTPAAVGLLAWALMYDWFSGNPNKLLYLWDTTQIGGRAWRHPMWHGIRIQWWSWWTGLIWFSPTLFLPAYSFFRRAYLKKATSFDFAILAAIVLQTLLYAKWTSPIGHEALGPRYLVVILPILFLWLDPDYFLKVPPLAKGFVSFIIAWGLFLQICNVSVKSQQYWFIKSRPPVRILTPHWIANAKIFMHKLRGEPEVYPVSMFSKYEGVVDCRGPQSFQGFNFWWAHLAWLYRDGGRPLDRGENTAEGSTL